MEDYMKYIVGTPEECIEKINSFIEIGVNYFILRFPEVIELNCLQLFAEDVIPTIKKG